MDNYIEMLVVSDEMPPKIADAVNEVSKKALGIARAIVIVQSEQKDYVIMIKSDFEGWYGELDE